MVGREGVLVVGEHLFVELFSRAQAGVLNSDILIRSEARKTDHSARKVVDLD